MELLGDCADSIDGGNGEVLSEHSEDDEGRPNADSDRFGSDMMLLDAGESSVCSGVIGGLSG
ncbi:hypothetical protein EV175_006735, partial [Coemansia sp. RSA 1933]